QQHPDRAWPGPGRWPLEPAPAGAAARDLHLARGLHYGGGRDVRNHRPPLPPGADRGAGSVPGGGGHPERGRMSRYRFTIPLVAFALLVVVLAVGIEQSPDKDLIPSPLIGKPAPDFSLPSLTDPGQRVSSTQLRGHWFIFNV